MNDRVQLRAVLTANGASCIASGALAAAAPGLTADVVGAGSTGVIRGVGVALAIYGADMVLAARSRRHLRTVAAVVTAGDVAWLVATAVVLASVSLSGWGVAVALGMGAAVATFAVLQTRLARGIAADDAASRTVAAQSLMATSPAR